MAFSKFDPHRAEEREASTSGDRRAMVLKWGWWISVVYTAIGFGFIVYWLVQ